jgi:hypothetical protein
MAGVGTRRRDLLVPPVAKDVDKHGKPIIGNRPRPIRTMTMPKFLGAYFFGDTVHLPIGFGPQQLKEYYGRNADVAWCIVGSVDVETVPKQFELPEEAKESRLFKTPASSMWQSTCGRYILYPPEDGPDGFTGFPVDSTETDFIEMWLPKKDWTEYYTRSSLPGVKYNYRNRKYNQFPIYSLAMILILLL